MESIIQKILDYGPSSVALVVMCYLLIQYMKASQKWADTVAANTEATRAQTEVLREMMIELREAKEVSEKVLETMGNCHSVKKNSFR